MPPNWNTEIVETGRHDRAEPRAQAHFRPTKVAVFEYKSLGDSLIRDERTKIQFTVLHAGKSHPKVKSVTTAGVAFQKRRTGLWNRQDTRDTLAIKHGTHLAPVCGSFLPSYRVQCESDCLRGSASCTAAITISWYYYRVYNTLRTVRGDFVLRIGVSYNLCDSPARKRLDNVNTKNKQIEIGLLVSVDMHMDQ